jgi:uncharacterized membrane protein (UPF0127 family)
MRAVIVVLGALVTAECQRAPAEDFPQRAGAPVASAATVAAPPPAAGSAVAAPAASAVPSASLSSPDSSLTGRCIRPTPTEPPAPARPGPAAGCPKDPEDGGPKLPEATVAFPDAGGAKVRVEVASAPHDTQRGLMYRRSMPEEHGMLFDLHTRTDHEFWMHNTCIPLDLLYVDQDGVVVGIVENAPTLDDSPRSVGCPSSYVIEVNAGWSRAHHVKAGQRVVLPAI